MSGVKVGVEIETNLVNNGGFISNRASEVIGDDSNKGGIVGELSRAMIETISDPYSDLSMLKSDLKSKLVNQKDIANKLGLRSMPVSTLHNESVVMSRDYERPRGMRKRIILGDEKRDLEHHLVGTHVHVDRLEGDEKGFKQYLAMQAMDPVFSFMSSSPFFHGKNSKNNYRVPIYRYNVFEDFPQEGGLLEYPNSLEDAFERQRDSYRRFVDLLKSNSLDDEGIKELDCMWGPLRLTSFGTVEARGSDANTLSNVMALAAMYKGISDLLDGEVIDLEIDSNDDYGVESLFVPHDGKMILPSYNRLKEFESIGILEGVSNPKLRTYLSNILSTSSLGLENDHYLSPFKNMIEEGRNFSDVIIDYAKSNGLEKDGRIEGIGAQQIRGYLADLYEGDLSA
jgi:gamma-glutamyl:cysteine ligase YbdK (ATP-grasp superfamily)